MEKRLGKSEVPNDQQGVVDDQPETGEPAVISTPFVDIAGLPLGALSDLDESCLAGALRRLRDEIAHPGEATAGFQNRA